MEELKALRKAYQGKRVVDKKGRVGAASYNEVFESRSGMVCMSKRRRSQRAGSAKRRESSDVGRQKTLDELWSRAGARNVAGVTYQVAVTVNLLVSGRCGTAPIARVMPEGYDDIDCTGSDGTTLFVQAKDRDAGEGHVKRAEFRDWLESQTLKSDNWRSKRFAFISDAEVSGGVPVTGWNQTLDTCASPKVDRRGHAPGHKAKSAHIG